MSSDGSGRANEPRLAFARVFPDRFARDDELGFQFDGFARTLAELAWNPENRTPFTVVVKGGWGRGKTTLLRRTQGLLEADRPDGGRRVRTLWFNAWKYPDDETVLAGLLGALIDRLRKGDKLDQLKDLVASYRGTALRGVLALAAPAELREQILGWGAASRFSPVDEKRAFHDTFRDLFNQVSRLLFDAKLALRDTGGLAEEELWSEEIQREETLAIFLDDLDRCPQRRVSQVLEAINLFLDLPGVCFYLGVDWNRLVAALPASVTRGEAGGGGDDAEERSRSAAEEGSRFLEKIVQVAFDLPAVSAPAAEEYVERLIRGTSLAPLLGEGEGEGGGDGDVAVLARALETRHPRHVKRFLNDLSISLAVLRNTGKLGPGEEQLPDRAVVAWHLLAEVLPEERWRVVRALPQNLMSFLREAERLEDEAAEGEEGVEKRDEWRRLRESGLPERHLAELRRLSDRQRHLLVHLATPPEVEVPRRRRGTERRHLLELDSSAWVEVPGGTFLMGAQKNHPDQPGYDPEAADDEAPPHRVTVDGFRLSRHPVTNAEYAVFVREAEKRAPDHWQDGEIPEGREHHPVVNVSWKDAEAFCTWMMERAGGAERQGVARLPTEAEWEYAARGAEGRRYPWGDEQPDEERANFGGNVGDTTEVGSYPEGATPEGVQDLAGNVWEWCADGPRRYSEDEEKNPIGPESGTSRVVRGGAFNYAPRYLRASFRNLDHPEVRYDFGGFRVLWSSSGGLESL